MWARHMEIAVGLWLAMSPFVFRHPGDATARWANDLACAVVIVTVSLAAHWRPLEQLHLALVPVALWLVAVGWWTAWTSDARFAPPHSQSWILTGLVLAIFAIVPSQASRPPRAWRAMRLGESSRAPEQLPSPRKEAG